MKTRKSVFQSEYLSLFFYCTLLIMIIFGVYLFGIRPFYINNDQMFQYPLFYQEWIALIKDCFAGKGLPLYSWRLFLGSDFYASMAYYVTGDVFLPLFFLFGIDTALIIETVLCFYISCFAMYGFLKDAGIQSVRNKTFISLIYAFGGWGSLYIGQYMFHRFYAFLPLLFWGAELFFHHRKRWLVALSVMLLFLQNYYLMWPLSICFLGYCIIREHENGKNGTAFWRDAWKLFTAYLCGTLLSGFLLLPAALYVVQNPRVGMVSNTGLFWPLKTIAGFFLSFTTSPFPVYTNISNLYRLDDNGYGYWYSLFITIIPLIASISWAKKKEHRSWLVFLLVLVCSALLKPLSVLFHGFSDPSMRWTFILEFILLYTAARALEDQEKGEQAVFTEYTVLCLVCICLTILVVGVNREYWPHYGSIIICFGLSLLIWYLWTHSRGKQALILSIAEITLSSCIMQNLFYHDIVYEDYRLGGEQLAYLQDTDEDLMYRYYIPIEDVEPSYPNLNISLKYGFMGTRTYNSVYDTLTDSFLHLQGIHDHRIDITDPDALTMLGVKYYLVEQENELPDGTFSYVTDLNGSLKIYQNGSYHGFGYTAPVMGYTNDVTAVKQMAQGIYADDAKVDITPYHSAEPETFIITAKSTNYLSGEIAADQESVLYLPIPCRKGWKVFVDGASVIPISVNGGFLGIPLTAGEHVIELNYLTPGLKHGMIASAAGTLLFILILAMDRKRV